MVSSANAVWNMKPLHVLRGIFRTLKTPLLSEDLVRKSTALSINRSNKVRSNETTAFLIRQYRMAETLASDVEREKMRKMATEFYQLRRDIAARGELYALDAGADQVLTPHETSRRAAARAGLQLPELYNDDVSDKTPSN